MSTTWTRLGQPSSHGHHYFRRTDRSGVAIGNSSGRIPMADVWVAYEGPHHVGAERSTLTLEGNDRVTVDTTELLWLVTGNHVAPSSLRFDKIEAAATLAHLHFTSKLDPAGINGPRRRRSSP